MLHAAHLQIIFRCMAAILVTRKGKDLLHLRVSPFLRSTNIAEGFKYYVTDLIWGINEDNSALMSIFQEHDYHGHLLNLTFVL